MPSQLHSRNRLFKFIVLAALLHLLPIVAIGVCTVYEEREPTLSGKFVKRRPLQQPVLRRPLLQPAPVRRMERAVEAPCAYARVVAPRPLYIDLKASDSKHGILRYPTDEYIPRYIEGIHLDGRLVLVYSQQSYRDFWSKRPERTLTEASEYILTIWNHVPHHRPSSTPAIRLGINVVVYALTQEGSLARRFVKSR